MAKILPYNGNYLAFASNPDANKRTVYGTPSVGAVFSDTLDGNMVEAYFKGWKDASTLPPMQYFNAALFTATHTLAGMYQNLALPWVSGQEKYIGDLSRGSDNKTYICLIANTTVNPVGDLTSTWELYGIGDFVTLDGAQTISGIKTFTASPIVPTAITVTQAVNKGQLDAITPTTIEHSLFCLDGTGVNPTFQQEGSFFALIVRIGLGTYTIDYDSAIVDANIIGLFANQYDAQETKISGRTTTSIIINTTDSNGILVDSGFSFGIRLKV